ncbi:MAG: zf-HC2 domain-containing protein [Deltaproteobacteria bacterium]|nr:zf-HC2 domain-containing protein [Deltaproteobacteria bacterium]
MNCRQARARLVAYQDHELSPGEERHLEDHLERCPSCAARLAELDEVALRPPLALLPEAEERWAARLDLAIAAARQEPPPARARGSREWVAWAAALALSLLWGGYQWYSAQALQEVLAQQQATAAAETIPSQWFLPAAWEGSDDERERDSWY